MSFIEAVRTVLSRYADFSGRARRSEYWYWSLAMSLGAVLVGIISTTFLSPGTLLGPVLGLAAFLPTLAVTVRRLHDADRPAWLVLIGLVPLLGGVVLLALAAQDGTSGPNRYGPSPKAVTDGAAPGNGYAT